MHFYRQPMALRVGLALLLAVLVPLPATSPARAVITFIGEIGSGAANAPSLTITTTTGVPAGGSIIVVASASGISGNTPGCHDSVNGGYSADSTQGAAVAMAVLNVCTKHNVAPTPVGTTITVTWPGPTGTAELHAIALAATGLAATLPDQTTGTGSTLQMGSALTTPLSATTHVPNELLIGGFYVSVSPAGAGFVAGTNGTANNCSNTGTPNYTAFPGVGIAASLWAEYCTVSAQAAYAAKGTISASHSYVGVLATYAEASPTPTPTNTPMPTNTPTPTVTPTATPPCILGDINCDGIVDIRDYGIWRQNFGQTNCGNPADLNNDCIVDIRDYGIWRANFGHTAGASPVRTATPTPRPSSAKPMRLAEAWPYGGARRVR
jgi:hypothetical protein